MSIKDTFVIQVKHLRGYFKNIWDHDLIKIMSNEDSDRLHKILSEALIRLDTDYEPYGQSFRSNADCSCGCDFFIMLAGSIGKDWGVCTNLKSHRHGLLTFEHQGCINFYRKGD